jgi:hypothetical protein
MLQISQTPHEKPSKMEPLVGFEPTTCSLRIPEHPAWIQGLFGKWHQIATMLPQRARHQENGKKYTDRR